MSLWLARNQESNEVVALQNALNAVLQPSKPLVLDGIFGPLTEAAVRDHQKRAGLKGDGIAGPRTLETLFEGVDVETKVTVESKEGRQPGERASFDAPARTPDPPGISFGTIGLLQRELTVRNWMLEGFPKAPLALAPWRSRLGPYDLAAMRLRAIPVRILTWEKSQEIKHHVSGEKGYAFEAEIGTSTSDFKEFEYELGFKMLQPKKEGFIKPSVSLKASPNGAWIATTKVSMSPFKIIDADWKRFTLEVNPLITASLTTPYILGDDPGERFPKLGGFAGLEAEATFRPVRRLKDVHLFFGGRAGVSGFLKFKDGKVEGGVTAPDLQLQIGLRVRFKLGN